MEEANVDELSRRIHTDEVRDAVQHVLRIRVSEKAGVEEEAACKSNEIVNDKTKFTNKSEGKKYVIF